MAFSPITSGQIDGGKNGSSDKLYFLGLPNHCRWCLQSQIKRCLFLGRNAMTTPDSVLRSKDIPLPKKVHVIKGVVIPGVMHECRSWTIKKAKCWRMDAFELWCWRRLLRVPWTARRSNQSLLKEINSEYSLEGMVLKWSSNSLPTCCKESAHGKRHWCWERLKARGKVDNRGWDGWMASPTQQTWLSASSRR